MSSGEFERKQEIRLAQDSDLDAAARKRVKERLSQDRQPSAAASSSTWVDWAAESDFLGQPWDVTKIPLAKLEQMRRDPILAFALTFIKTPLVRAPWYIKSSDPKVAAAVDASLRRIYGRFILAYCNSLDYGFSPMVKRFEYEEKPDWVYVDKDNPDAVETPVWNYKTIKPIVWKPFTALNPRRCSPHWTATGKFNGIDFTQSGLQSPFFTSGHPLNETSKEWASQKRQADIQLDWALWATNAKDTVFGSYWGYPRIGYAYRFWWAYWYRFGVADRAFEKWGDPPMVGYHPDDPLAVDSAGNPVDYTTVMLDLLESARSGANIAIPSGVVTSMDERPTGMREWEITQLQTKTDFGAIGDVFRYLDTQKLRSVMVPEQALIEGEGGTSSRNVASTFGEMFQQAQAVIKEEIDDHLNRWVIPQFVELNFGANAARAEIVTTGFDQMDMDVMSSVLQLVGQRKLLSVIDERELAERMNIPTVSRAEMLKREAKAVAEAEQMHAREMEAKAGPNGQSGVTDTGLYYGARERIVLGDSVLPYMIERVAELPVGNSPAYFDTETRTLYVTEDSDEQGVKGYLIGLAQNSEKGESALPDNIDVVLSEFAKMNEKIDGIEKETKVQVELNQPDPEDPTIFRTRRKVLERDDDGFIKDSAEWKERIEDKEDE